MFFSRGFIKIVSCFLILAQILLLVPETRAEVFRIRSKEFDDFLDSCGLEEKIQLALSLDMISQEDADIKNSKNWLKLGITKEKIKQKVAYLSYHLLNLGQDGSSIDYHDIVKWVAGSLGIKTKGKGTMSLEEDVVKQFMAKIWDSLNTDQRLSVLEKLEIETGHFIPNKLELVAKSGICAVATLIALKSAVGGFVFFQYAMSFFYIVTGLLGVTMHWGVVAPALAFLTGPIGIALVVVASVLTLGSANPNDVVKFVITVYFLRSQKTAKVSNSVNFSNSKISIASIPKGLKKQPGCQHCNSGYFLNYDTNEFSIPCTFCNK